MPETLIGRYNEWLSAQECADGAHRVVQRRGWPDGAIIDSWCTRCGCRWVGGAP